MCIRDRSKADSSLSDVGGDTRYLLYFLQGACSECVTVVLHRYQSLVLSLIHISCFIRRNISKASHRRGVRGMIRFILLTPRRWLALEIFRRLKHERVEEHPLRQLFWECTFRCNVRCRHCGSDCKSSPACLLYTSLMRSIILSVGLYFCKLSIYTYLY